MPVESPIGTGFKTLQEEERRDNEDRKIEEECMERSIEYNDKKKIEEKEEEDEEEESPITTGIKILKGKGRRDNKEWKIEEEFIEGSIEDNDKKKTEEKKEEDKEEELPITTGIKTLQEEERRDNEDRKIEEECIENSIEDNSKKEIEEIVKDMKGQEEAGEEDMEENGDVNIKNRDSTEEINIDGLTTVVPSVGSNRSPTSSPTENADELNGKNGEQPKETAHSGGQLENFTEKNNIEESNKTSDTEATNDN